MSDAQTHRTELKPFLEQLETPILFRGDETTAYRDPSLYYHDGVFYLVFNLVKSAGGIQQPGKSLPDRTLRVAVTTSRDLKTWSKINVLTAGDKTRNFHPAGNLVRFQDEWILGLCSYPTPNDEKYGNQDARGYLMRSKDLTDWSEPELIPLLGPEVPFEKMGRILGTSFLEDRDEAGLWWAFYKHGGGHISASRTRDFQTWEPLGRTGIHGENECLLVVDGWYWLVSSPGDGIDFSRSRDLKTWETVRNERLGQKDWPWAQGRLTAAHVVDLRQVPGVGKFVMVFHGSDFAEEDPRGGFDNFASIGIAWSDDLSTWQWPGKSVHTPEKMAAPCARPSAGTSNPRGGEPR